LLLVDSKDDHNPSLIVGFPYKPICVFFKVDGPCTLPVLREFRPCLGIFRDEANLIPGALPSLAVHSPELTEIVRRLRGVLDSKLGDGRLLVVGLKLAV
jgi:hypothetical protein